MMTAAGGDERGTDLRVVNLQQGLSDTEGVATLTPPQINKNGDVVLLSVPTTSPASDDTADLVGHVRDSVLPKTNEGTGVSGAGPSTCSASTRRPRRCRSPATYP